MANTDDSVERFNWLYPDLLSKRELINILTKRYIKVTDLEQLQKDELVELYNKYVLPLPQRKHRLNRRGQEMTKKQILQSKKRKHTEGLAPDLSKSEGEPPEKRSSTGQLQNHFSSSSTTEGNRLKPPPSCINFEKKKIKLNSGTKSQTESPISSSLNNLKINQTVNSSFSVEPVDSDTNEVVKKKIKLKGNKKTSDELDSDTHSATPMDTSEQSEDDVTPKKKIKKIAWP